mgnify:CR=1 FL=1
MRSSLSERIAKNQSNKKGTDNSKNKVAFLALKQDIASALLDGWSMKAIWETLSSEKSISFSYKTFCQYVLRFIEITHKPQTQENTREDEKDRSKSPNEIRSFTFNPKPNLEELL